ncbi:hypothetical protein C0Q70_05407 [Pomacea canaliculata]|uniref:Tetraspanin n=1 Tax=Pomacea canaliculata TaxID=400727 RepID=A0A2T7PL67_POMCA|nr:hypothetical protein C0Q70_05407 [Pomacea canaliculata]
MPLVVFAELCRFLQKANPSQVAAARNVLLSCSTQMLLGCAILGVGIWLRVDPNVAKYVNQAEEINVFFTLAYILMAIGIIIMVIGFLGCCGAIRESQCMLGAFFLLLFIIFAILLGAGIWAVVEKDTMNTLLGS